jgi:hypothetical protein
LCSSPNIIRMIRSRGWNGKGKYGGEDCIHDFGGKARRKDD